MLENFTPEGQEEPRESWAYDIFNPIPQMSARQQEQEENKDKEQ